MKKILMVDPPGGWKYGFPLPFPDDNNYQKLLIEQGYPIEDILLALEYSRYWEESTS